MSFETISEEGRPDYEIWTCDDCSYSITLNGVGGDVADCRKCITDECNCNDKEPCGTHEDMILEEARDRDRGI